MGWARRGRRLRVPTTSQHRERLNLFGWVTPLLGRRVMIRWPQGDREGFIAYLKHLYRRLQGYTIWLYVDRARWHKGEEVNLFIRTHMRLRLTYLQSYQPALNPQERIWRQVQYEATANCWFKALDLVWDTVQQTTRTWTSNKIKHLCQITYCLCISSGNYLSLYRLRSFLAIASPSSVVDEVPPRSKVKTFPSRRTSFTDSSICKAISVSPK